jgi:hypothetical protein
MMVSAYSPRLSFPRPFLSVGPRERQSDGELVLPFCIKRIILAQLGGMGVYHPFTLCRLPFVKFTSCLSSYAALALIPAEADSLNAVP